MKKVVKISLVIVSCLLVIFALIFAGFFVFINTSQSGVQFDKYMLQEANSTIDIYNLNNEKINSKNGKKALVKYEELPSYVMDAFISIEDKNFYKHDGLNYKRIIKAMINNVKSRSFKEGASTISQQLIKNTHLSSEKTIARKLDEMALTRELEKTFTKDEILETYLNVIYFGNGAYGLENASQIYFNKTANKLSISEAALLAGLIKSPKTYSPILNPENSLKRRNLVLNEMKKDGKISPDDYEKAISEPVCISKELNTSAIRNFYEEAVIKEAEQILNLTEQQIALGGYKIFSYQNSTDQKALETAVNNMDFYNKNAYGNIADSCAVIIDNKTGGVSAFGGKSAYDLVNMKRSPGSSIKPILVYAPALECGKISPCSPILDEKTSFGNYNPQNVGGIYYGWIDANKSVEKSLNIPAIKIMRATGVDNCKKMAENCGISFGSMDNGYALALGGLTNGTTVLELVNTYLPFANNGNFTQARFIKKICTEKGKVIYENMTKNNKVMSEETAYLVTEMLQNSVKKGTSSRLNTLGFDIAGKTGTVGIKGTNLNSDVWSVGYTPQKTIGVWLGNSTGNEKYMLEGRNNGGTFCTSMLKNIFENTATNKQLKFEKPKGIVEVVLDKNSLEKNHSLLLANPETPDRYTTTASFNKKYMPTNYAEKFEIDNICKITVDLENFNPKIKFNAIKNAKYKLYRIEEDNRKLIQEFENISGETEHIDKTSKSDTTYIYYMEITLKGEEKVIKSNSEKITTPARERGTIKKLFDLW